MSSYSHVKKPRSTTVVHLFEERNGKIRLRPLVEKMIEKGGVRHAAKRMDVSEEVLDNALTYLDLWPKAHMKQRILNEFRKGLDEGQKPDVLVLADKLCVDKSEVYAAIQEESDRLLNLHIVTDTTTEVTISGAVRRGYASRATIQRAIKNGRIHVNREHQGFKYIKVSELDRVFRDEQPSEQPDLVYKILEGADRDLLNNPEHA